MKYKNKSQLSILLSIFFSTIFSAINASAASPIINISSTNVGITPGNSERVNIDTTDFYGTITVSSSNAAVASVKMLGCESAEVCTVRNRNVVLTIQGLSTGSASATVSFSGAISSSDIRLNETQKIDITVNNSDTSLASLAVSPFQINFNNSVTEYTVTAEHDLTSVEVTATATSPTTTVSGIGTYTLKDYLNTIEVITTAEDGSQASYKIKIKRKDSDGRTAVAKKSDKDASSKDNTLKDIVIIGYDIDFNSEKTEYSITVKPNTGSLMIRAVPNNGEAKVEVKGGDDIKVGDNIIKIIVTAENGETKEYQIKVKRPVNKDAVGVTKDSKDGNLDVLGVTANGKESNNILPIVFGIAAGVFTVAGIITTVVFLRKKSDNRRKQFNVMRVNNGFRPNSIG